jgi:hypothetical protein
VISSCPFQILCPLFIYCQSFPIFSNHSIVISITVRSSRRSYIEYTQVSSPVCQYAINLIVSLSIRGGPGVLLNVSVREHPDLTNKFLDVAKFTIPTPLSLLACCKLLFRIVGLKIFSLPTSALKSPNKIYIWYLGKSSKACSNSS